MAFEIIIYRRRSVLSQADSNDPVARLPITWRRLNDRATNRSSCRDRAARDCLLHYDEHLYLSIVLRLSRYVKMSRPGNSSAILLCIPKRLAKTAMQADSSIVNAMIWSNCPSPMSQLPSLGSPCATLLLPTRPQFLSCPTSLACRRHPRTSVSHHRHQSRLSHHPDSCSGTRHGMYGP